MEKISENIRDLNQKVKTKLELLPRLLSDMAQLQSAAILLGDFDLKIIRKKHQLKKQEQVYTFFLEQHSRQLLLIQHLDSEMISHKDTWGLLSALEKELNEMIVTQKSRLVSLFKKYLKNF